MKKLDIRGFALVEGLLIVIALALVTGVGYYVYHTQNEENKPQTSQNTSNTQGNESQQASTDSAKADNLAGYVAVKEWGVKVAIRDAEKVQYTIDNTPNTVISGDTYESHLSPSFKPEALQDKSCTPGVGMYRSKTKFANVGEDNQKKVGDYYYFVTGGPGACSDNPETNPDDQLKTRFLADFAPKNVTSL